MRRTPPGHAAFTRVSAASVQQMSLLARYRELLGTGGAGPALAFSIVGRLSVGMTGLAILLLVRSATGSYAAAGAVSAAAVNGDARFNFS